MKYAKEAARRARAALPHDRVAWQVHVMIACHVDKDGAAFPGPGVRELGQLCDRHPEYIGKAIHRLETVGLLKVARGRGGGDLTGYILPWIEELRALEARSELSTTARPPRALRARATARPKGAPKELVRTEGESARAPFPSRPHKSPCLCPELCLPYLESLVAPRSEHPCHVDSEQPPSSPWFWQRSPLQLVPPPGDARSTSRS